MPATLDALDKALAARAEMPIFLLRAIGNIAIELEHGTIDRHELAKRMEHVEKAAHNYYMAPTLKNKEALDVAVVDTRRA